MISQFHHNLSNYSYNRMFEKVDGFIQPNVSIFQVSHIFPGKIMLEWKNKSHVLFALVT